MQRQDVRNAFQQQIVDPDAPAHGFCIICALLSEHVPDPVELVELRDRIARDLAD